MTTSLTVSAQETTSPEVFADRPPEFKPGRSVVVVPEQPRRGDLFVIYLKSDDLLLRRLPAKVFNYDFELLRVSDDMMRGIAAVPLEAKAGTYTIKIFMPDRDIDVSLTALHRDWPISILSVSGRFTAEPDLRVQKILDEDQRAWTKMWRDVPTRPKHRGAFVRPVKGRTTAVFGTKRTFNGQLKTRHEGLDLKGGVGVPIKALAAGRVVMSSDRFVSGGTTTLDHGNGLFTSYFHMSRRSKEVGDWVNAGERIGRVGSSGRVTGPHLHLAVMIRVEVHSPEGGLKSQGLYADPAPLLNFGLWGDPDYLEVPARR